MARLAARKAVDPLTGAGRFPRAWTQMGQQGGTVLPYKFPEWAGPPPGTYNPAIEAEVETSQAKLEHLLEQLHREGKRSGQDVSQREREIETKLRQGGADIAREKGYAATDTSYKLGQLGTNYGRSLSTLGINFRRDIQDLSQARQRGDQDYSRTLTDLQHRYGSAAEQQTQNAIAMQSNDAGTAAASTAVRGANQTYDKAGIDLSHVRQGDDLNTREGRDQEDYARSVANLGQDYGTDVAQTTQNARRQNTAFGINQNRLSQASRQSLHAVTLAASRAGQDRATKASEAKAEQGLYEQHAAESAYYEAHQLHPKIQFPGSQHPAAPAAGPHVYAAVPAYSPRPNGPGRPVRPRSRPAAPAY